MLKLSNRWRGVETLHQRVWLCNFQPQIYSATALAAIATVDRETYPFPCKALLIQVCESFCKALMVLCFPRRFFMPHGLHIDHEDNVWITDVALHQVSSHSPCELSANCFSG